MNRLLISLASVVVSWTAVAQVSLPFDVPSPTWKGILTSKVENGPLVFQKPNPSSDNLIQIEAGEETNYKWQSPSIFLNEIESKFTIGPYSFIPYISTSGAWVEVEVSGDNGIFKGWSLARDLQSVRIVEITLQDLTDDPKVVAWQHGGETYVIIESTGYYGWTGFSIGKLKDGYVVCPYFCFLDWGDTVHPGILNGKLSSEGPNLSKFTLKDVKYILEHAQKSNDNTFVGYGFIHDGERVFGGNWTTLVSKY